ncbi:hypothetical protein ACIQ6V_31750 [Streptomyces sp. NPDC096198]|uniref:hypothetical protein n=1 Tax=Streptomyces sp. NPDC096198 TaxID=3366080 RepID=UPI003829BD77
MIGERRTRRAPGRPGHLGLVLGLVLLITAHLSGALHAAPFAGPHVPVETAASAGRPAGTGHEGEPEPAHQHDGGVHIDHAADRPRTTADATLAAHPRARPAVTPSPPGGTTVLTALRGLPSHTLPPPKDSRSPLALHCVWRL